jgi:hypothetical protein
VVAPAAAPAPAPAAATDTAVVQLDADDHRATIERRLGTQSASGIPLVETGLFSVGQWQQACVAPCSLSLDTRYSYRVAGDGLVPTDSFVLPRSVDRVRVDAKMGSSTGRVAGALVTGGGLLAVAAGTVALIATPILHSEDVGSEGFRTGVFAGGLAAGTYPLAGAELSQSTCGACVNLIADIVTGQGPSKFYFATGGSLTLTATSPPAGSISAVTFQEVDAGGTMIAGGCIARMESMSFTTN